MMKDATGAPVYAEKTKILKGIVRGEHAIREDRVISHIDARKAFAKWLKPAV